ncbi:MAG: hypothetical protein WA705_17540 [Candidatus Ozemobacteraceae bacterium]
MQFTSVYTSDINGGWNDAVFIKELGSRRDVLFADAYPGAPFGYLQDIAATEYLDLDLFAWNTESLEEIEHRSDHRVDKFIAVIDTLAWMRRRTAFWKQRMADARETSMKVEHGYRYA